VLYYALLIDNTQLYVANNMTLSEDEALRYDSKAQRISVRALLVWVGFEPFRTFQQQLLSVEQDNQNCSPFQELLEYIRAGRLSLLELKALHLSYQLHRYSTQVEFLAINPCGPQQRVQKIEKFLEDLEA
jgi:hypothetical protein